MSDPRILVKLRPGGAAAADSRANLRPLRPAAAQPFGVGSQPQWYVAEISDAAALPWDTAHARIADQLGLRAEEVLFAEPDLVHSIFVDETDTKAGFAVVGNCTNARQDDSHHKAAGPGAGWHLEDAFTQLRGAREAVEFQDRRTRIAHFDTGYFAAQVTVPEHLRHDLERNFVDRERGSDASDPDNRLLLLDSSGHGTGTLSILAGRACGLSKGEPMGAAAAADIVPLRIADSVVLLRTSSFAAALDYAVDQGCDVGSMSMGGLPSRAWRESVDRAYLAGFCLVAAAGNCVNGLPTRHVVYPARYGRVIAACGVMADGKPYAGLSGATLEGNFGPDHVMRSALAAYTPNVWWAEFGCTDAVRQNGQGTSSATPQIAAAVALWFEKFKASLPRDWRRVESVRQALFTTAKQRDNASRLGNGIVQALNALGVIPQLDLPQTPADRDSFAFLRVLTGLGITLNASTPSSAREAMFDLEIMQRWLLSQPLQALVPDPDATRELTPKVLASVMEALIEDRSTSLALRKHLVERYRIVTGAIPPAQLPSEVVPRVLAACDAVPALQAPPYRRLRVYALDPSLATQFASAGINQATLEVRWEALQPGPIGEYLEVVDVDAAGTRYAGVNLDDARLAAQHGWAPSEGNPQFHQQMTYAVAMATIAHFERALGRPVLWRCAAVEGKPFDDSVFVPRLQIRPHALRQANAFYSPSEVALLFGYFEDSGEPGSDLAAGQVPGSRIYTCLSHDIIAHETTHAILDGMHRRFAEASNLDTLALHEGFADIVALFQHFTMRELLCNQIAQTRGNLEAESLLGGLAVQFGRATGRHGALRDAIGRFENGVWQRLPRDPAALQKCLTPHARGAVLVAAVFDAYLAIYKARTADLIRIYTGGTGVLPNGAIHPDLVARLADAAATLASQVLTMCIRGLDYVPPVDVTFFEYLRGIITADFDCFPNDAFHHRVAFIEAFRARGIYPLELEVADGGTLRTLSADTVRWQEMQMFNLPREVEQNYLDIVKALRQYADATLYCPSRRDLFELTRQRRELLHEELKSTFKTQRNVARDLGLDPQASFEVHELRCAARTGEDGRYLPQLIIALTQSQRVAATERHPAFTMHGGATLVVDLTQGRVKYRIFKNVNSASRKARAAAFAAANAGDPLRQLMFGSRHSEPFAVLHSLGAE